MEPLARVLGLPCWQGAVRAEPLGGGLTNQNFLVQDGARRAVVRIGEDIPVHQILRSNELAASIAAHAAGVSPEVIYHERGALVIGFVEGRTLSAADFAEAALLEAAVALVAQAHREIPRYFRGPAMLFWVFQVLRDYTARLEDEGTQYLPLLAELTLEAGLLEAAVGQVDLVFGHNDLLPANFIHDGTRMWLIDWDYAGFNSPLFDLGGLAANNGLTVAQESLVLQQYFGSVDGALWRRYLAMKAAAALRETLWSMVSETHSELDFDYATYTATNLATYRAAFAAFAES
jgi:thiamine kinase-like enzyme